MRGTIAFACSTLALMSGLAQAGVSDDLVFCSKLQNSRERIACYDAAARIAANIARSTTQPVAAPMASAPAAATGLPYKATAAPKRAPFHGPYVAVGGGYGMTGPVTFGTVDAVSGFAGTGQPTGPSALAMAGINLQYGHLVTGLEVSARFGRERFSDSQFASVNGGEFGVIGQSTKSYKFNSDANVHLALRAGLAIDNTLIYGKLGIGGAHVAESMQVSTLGTFCALQMFVGNTVVCASRAPVIPAQSISTSRWYPSVLLGAGVEQNFGPFFARIEGQAEAIRGPNSINEWLWGVRGIGAIGFRFSPIDM